MLLLYNNIQRRIFHQGFLYLLINTIQHRIFLDLHFQWVNNNLQVILFQKFNLLDYYKLRQICNNIQQYNLLLGLIFQKLLNIFPDHI